MTPEEREKLKTAIVHLAEAIAKQPLPHQARKEPSMSDYAHLPAKAGASEKWGMDEDRETFLNDGNGNIRERQKLRLDIMRDHPMKLLLELQIEGRIPKEVFADDRRYFALLNKLGC